MKATTKQLKQSIGKEVWIKPLGNLKPRVKRDYETLICGVVKSVSSVNVTFEKGIGICGVEKIRIDGRYDRHNCGGEIYLSKEEAIKDLWRYEFITDLRYNLDLSPLTYDDCRIIEQMLNKEQK